MQVSIHKVFKKIRAEHKKVFFKDKRALLYLSTCRAWSFMYVYINNIRKMQEHAHWQS